MASARSAVAARLSVRRTRSEIRRLHQGGVESGTLSQLGDAYLELAERLARLDRFSEAAEEFDTAYKTLVTAGQGAAAARVRVRLAGVLMVLGRREEALEAVEAVIDGGGRVEDAADVMPMAYLWRVVALHELGRDADALTKARRLVKRFAPGATDLQRQIVAKALLLEGEMALDGGDGAGAVRAVTKIIDTYGAEAGSGSQSLCDTVAEARRRLSALPDD